jgi:hypothetical protein
MKPKHVYLLHSVLVHQGDDGGHYYAYIRPSPQASPEPAVQSHGTNASVSSSVGAMEVDGKKDDVSGDIQSQKQQQQQNWHESSKWFKFNDENVHRVEAREALNGCFGTSPGRQ